MSDGSRDPRGDERSRSAEACPECGAHRLAILDFPDVPTLGVQPYSELLGMGDLHATTPPGIGCLACGAEWHDLAAFRAGEAPTRKPEG